MNVEDPAFPIDDVTIASREGLTKLEYTTIHIYCAYVSAGKVSQVGAEEMTKRSREEALILLKELS